MSKFKKVSKRIIAFVLTFTLLFGGMISVSAAEYTSGSYTYTVADGKAKITAYPETAKGAVEIPSKLGGYPVAEIGAYAFYACTLITEVTIPSGVTKIGDYAFAYCTTLSTVEIPSSVTSIGNNAFKNSNDVVIECEKGSYAEEYANANEINTEKRKSTIITIEETTISKFVGSKFAVSASFSSSVYLPNNENVFYEISGPAGGLIVDGGMSFLGTKDDGIISLPLKAVREGTYVVSFKSIDDSVDSVSVVITKKLYPDGYAFSSDRYDFSNLDEKIEKSYYTEMFGDSRGDVIFGWGEDGSKHGHCFGMSITTAATLVNCPNVTDYISWLATPYTELVDVNAGTSNIDLGMTARDYIKYGHIYQFSDDVQTMRASDSYNGIENVYEAVADYVVNDGSPVIIDLWGGVPAHDISDTSYHAGHTVYAIGIDGEDILINDSNEPDTVTRIEINGDNWEYTGGGWYWSDDIGASINYVTDSAIITPYLNRRYAVDVSGATSVDGDKISEKMLLIETDKNAYNFEGEVLEVKVTDMPVNNEKDLYWIALGNEIKAKNDSGDFSELNVVGNDSKINVNLPSSSEVKIDIDDDKKINMNIDTMSCNNVSFTFSETVRGSTINYNISGNTDREIHATLTTSGLSVVGMDDVTVSVFGDEINSTKKIEDMGGALFEVIINEDNFDIVVNSESNLLSVENVSLNYKTTVNLAKKISGDILWSSSDESVAKVDSNGNVTAVGTGTAIITATVEGTDISDSCEVTVSYAWWQWIIRILLLGFLWY